MTDGPPGRVLMFALLTVTLVVVVGAGLYAPEIVVGLRRLAHCVWPPPEPVVRPPIEHIAGHARRLRAEVLALRPDTPMARRRGLLLAYDDQLADACAALEIPDTLSGLDPGTDRDAERLRVEHELEVAGLPLGS